MWHVLVVDDHPDICDVVKMGLEIGSAFRVTCAANAADALATLHRDRPDVAIIDVVMAGIGGLGLAKRTLDLDIPVLLMTGAPLADEQLQTIDRPHILKPFRLRELVGQTLQLLADAKARQANLRAALERMDRRWRASKISGDTAVSAYETMVIIRRSYGSGQ
jgi:two-component system, OmpR family, response regulator MprA